MGAVSVWGDENVLEMMVAQYINVLNVTDLCIKKTVDCYEYFITIKK